MKMLTSFYLRIFAVLLLFFCFANVVRADYTLGTDDILQIKVYGYDDLTTSARVSENGRIVFPMIGEVNVAGKSELEIARTIAQSLEKAGLVQGASVSVTVLEYKNQQVSVLGQVKAPGVYVLRAKNSLIDLIAMAGGINEFGDSRVVITRQVNGKPVKQEVDLRAALESSDHVPAVFIERNDIIYVPKAPVFYISGEVQKPGGYRLEHDMTVAQAIATGGGLTQRGTLRDMVIERRDASGVAQTIEARLSDKVIQGDVIVVDERWF
jgi:polysaccharide export outer membrane protein